jgi:fused signal recognition particle receptor
VAFLFWKKKKPADAAVSTAEVESAEPEVIEATAVAAEPEIAEAPSEVEVAIHETEVIEEPEVVEVVAVQLDEATDVVAQPEPEPEPELVAVELPKRSARKGIRSLFSRIKFDPTDLDALEDVLLTADFGIDASAQIVDQVKATAKQTGAQTEAELKQILADVIASNLEREDKALNLSDGKLPYVFLVVGVNGVGKTTTIGKLANWLREGEWDVVIGAADTFRAAAVDQIATWADRAGAKLVRPKIEGQDPASVAFEATETAVRDDADILIIDTAGRLQNKADLMQELDKIRRVVEKTAQISEVLLVLDATTGQNGLTQAKAFAEVANVTGVVLTKLDGTARGGIVYSIQRELNIPVKLVGVGEGIDDFAFFDATEFAAGLVS